MTAAPVAARDRALRDWYRLNSRPLPWRTTRHPWPILVSEVMSHQTQITRVVPAYERFLDRFPNPGELAGADLAEVLRLWDGLGYQRRAVNLWRTAAIVADGGWPEDVAGLSRLPGVGPYTAAAVACFAFGAPVAAVDTNLRRVVGRWIGRPVLANESLDELVDGHDPAGWNQAIMDLGATVCRPASPDCAACPVSDWCADPTVYVAPPRQTPYEGSVRQARAAILKALARGEQMRVPDSGTVAAEAMQALAAEGLVASRGDLIHLADQAGLIG